MDRGAAPKLTAHQAACLKRIQACEASGMSLSAYAAKHGLDVRSLYAARKVLKRRGLLAANRGSVGFQRAEIAAGRRDAQWRIELANGAAIEFSGPVDGGGLSTVLAAVSELD